MRAPVIKLDWKPLAGAGPSNVSAKPLASAVAYVSGRQETTPGDLAARFGLTPQSALHRLRAAEAKGLITQVRDGVFAGLPPR